MAAVAAHIGIATADLFPRVNLVGSFGYLSASVSDLLDQSTQEYSFGPRLTWAAFDLSRVRARIRAVEAKGRLAAYHRTVLRA